MPIQLRTTDDIGDQMVISLADYKQGRANFRDHYFLADCNQDFGGQDIGILWDDLNALVEGFMVDMETTDVALRFIYCYNSVDTCMFLRVQLCRMEEIEQAAGTFALVNTNSRWYEIVDGSIAPTQNTMHIDQQYFDDFYYCISGECDASTLQPLTDDVEGGLYARSVTFPWKQEIQLMYKQNKSPKDASIYFGATSYAHSIEASTVKYPHGLVLYLVDSEGNALLDNDDYIVKFENKGCDYGTLCPPTCNVYMYPKVIPQNK